MDERHDPISELMEATISQHEMYLSWIHAGFTEEQAFELLKAVIVAIVRGAGT